MAIALKCNACGQDIQEQLAGDNPLCPACGKALQSPVESLPEVLRVSAADVVKPAAAPLPRLQTFDELDISEPLRKAVEGELAKDEKIVWLGRPSRNPAVHPPKTIMAVIGCVMLGLAVLLPLVFRGMPFIFPVACGLFGAVFLAGFWFMNPANSYHACYVLTDRRAILVEPGVLGLGLQSGPMGAMQRHSYKPQQLVALERRNNPRVPGAGDLIFEYVFTVNDASGRFASAGGTLQRTDKPQRTPRGFFFLDQVSEVEDLIRETLLANLEKKLDQDAKAPGSLTSPVSDAQAQPISAACKCGATIEAPGELTGQSVKCPKCAGVVVLPGGRAAETAAPEADNYREDGAVPADLKEKARGELGRGERLVWLAQPKTEIIFRRSLAYLVGGGLIVLFGLLLLAGAFAGKAGGAGKAAVQTPPPAGIMAGLPVVVLLIGAGCLLVPVYRWQMAQRSCYALTNRRALVFKQGLFGPTRESYSPGEVAQMRRSDSWVFANGGDLIFRSVTVITHSRNQQGISSSATTTHYGFLDIVHIGDVEKLVRETLIDRYAGNAV
ncbi:hypothetical protein AYO44_08245 [Planctomycetaceae bacterium SCGC AG-212-F19]|nr:hypothetical protein AYO44_08245 [Planctomycetaceae bacterium SCGC AG-212-F19]